MKESINCIICNEPIAVITFTNGCKIETNLDIEIKDICVCGECLKNKNFEDIKLLADI